MYQESFEILREIASLQNYKKQGEQTIEQHQKRVIDFEQKLADCLFKQESLQADISSAHQIKLESETLYANHQTHLEKAKEHLSMSTSQAQMNAGEKELHRLQEEIEQCEENLFSLMEQEESLQEELTQKKKEYSGLQASLQEIKSEVDADINNEQQKIEGLVDRIKILEQQLHPEVYKVYLNLMEHLHPPFAEVINGKCSECAIQIPANTEQAINTAKSLEHCGGCGRLFLVR